MTPLITSTGGKRSVSVHGIPAPSDSNDAAAVKVTEAESHEIFQVGVDGVEFRTVSLVRAIILFVKIEFAMSILAIPQALATLGAVGGGISIIVWTSLNTYTGVILGEFRTRHPECHMLADMMGFIWGRAGRELVGAQLVIAQILVSAGGIVTTATAFNALTEHSRCTVVFALISTILITSCSSIRTFSRLGWVTWFGFLTFFLAVFIFVVAVGVQDLPASALVTGDFNLGFRAIAYPTFISGMIMTANIFISTSGTSMYLPIISEMRKPQDFKKAVIWAGVIVGIIYFCFPMATYRYCGDWLLTPAFGSAGPLFKKICYGVALPGLIIGVGIYQHVAAKYVFVRLLRDSKHLQANTVTHWSTWLGVNVTLGALGFLVAEAVPILNFLLGLAGALCFAPFSLVFPMMLWMHDFKAWRSGSVAQRVRYGFHLAILILGLYMVVAGTYSVAVGIRDAFASGFIARTFDCSDNSGSVKPRL